MSLQLPTLCVACKHFRPKENDDDTPTCDAYPDGIPWEFWGGGVAHNDSHGEGGIVFESIDGFDDVIDAFIGYWMSVRDTDEDSYSAPVD